MIKVGDLVRVRRQHPDPRKRMRLGDQYVIGIAMVIDAEDGYNTIIDVQLSDGRWCSGALCDVEVLNESR